MITPNPAELNFQDHTILVVDDNPTNLGVIVNYLEDCGFRLLVARDGETGLKSAQNAKPDLILLDVMMPGINGFETCRRLKEDETTADIPVIFMTALAETEDKIRGFQVGGVDYVTKPIQQEEVLARVTAHLKIRNLTRKLQAQNEDLQELTFELHEMNNELLKVTDDVRDANVALSKRAVQLEASNQVGQRITAILGLDELLPEMVKVIRAKFGYYFVGVWLVSDQHNHVVLQASASRDEAQKLQPGFAIPLTNSSKSLIASVCQNGQARLTDRIDPELPYQIMEELPETRSKLALPLRIGEETFGVLDIQSDHLAAFDSEDQKALQTLANQIAVAIRNAWLYGMEKKMRSMEEEKNQALAKINADKDKFFSIISHDLRGPFTSLLGNAQFMAEVINELSQKDIQEMAQGMYNGAKAVYGLLDNLLTWSRMQRQGGMEYHPEAIELRPLAQKTVEVLGQTAAQKNIRLDNTIPDQFTVYADEHMLDTVIRNLTNNALKFTPNNGAVTLSARPGQGKFIEIAVKDTGVGISKQDMDKLFKLGDNHSTLGTNREQGSGLGLIICKEMIERNGGRIWIDSEPGKGTTVRFTMPLPGRG